MTGDNFAATCQWSGGQEASGRRGRDDYNTLGRFVTAVQTRFHLKCNATPTRRDFGCVLQPDVTCACKIKVKSVRARNSKFFQRVLLYSNFYSHSADRTANRNWNTSPFAS